MKRLEKALIELGKDSPFYLYILLGMKRVKTETVRTLSLGFSRRGDIILFYNPKIENKDIRFIKALLKHEAMHLINQHFLIKPKDERDRKIWDLAMDAAINQYIEELDAFGISLNQLIEEGHGVDNEYIFAVPPAEHPGETAEFYHEWMLKKMEELGRFDIEAIPESVDDHSKMREDQPSVDMILEITKSKVGKAFNIYGGDLPSGVQRMVEKFLSRPTLSWRVLMRRFMGVSVKGDRYTTPLRPNRRYEDQPGWRYEYQSKIAAILDTSGSIIESEINDFLSELEGLMKFFEGEIHLIQIDNVVTSVSKYRKGKWREVEIVGGGETDLQPAVIFAEENLRCEGTIVFSDGHADVPIAKRRILFVLSKFHNPDFKREAMKLYGPSSVVVIE